MKDNLNIKPEEPAEEIRSVLLVARITCFRHVDMGSIPIPSA